MFIKLCNGFLKSSEFEKVVRNENFGDRVVFEGRPVFVATPITLSDGEKKKKEIGTACCFNEYINSRSTFRVSQNQILFNYLL